MSHHWLIALLACPLLSGQQFAHYDIYRAASPVVVDGKLDEPAWKQAPAAGDFHPVGDEANVRQQTIVKLAWDDENLYLGYYCLDRRISAYITERHGPVSQGGGRMPTVRLTQNIQRHVACPAREVEGVARSGARTW
ncbi:MAG TPA: carbohydrate-binding family 9-like protein [Bryobacterales bacterium]|nr:carbohydrate-binding family 9-like protein [Bryobacterales bacterium]